MSDTPNDTRTFTAVPESHAIAGATHGSVRLLLQGEGLGVLILAATLYHGTGHGWGLFAALFLLPDLSFVAYLAGPRVGAAAYNVTHSYLGPLALLVVGFPVPTMMACVYIWAAHIGFDRLMRYGLKYPDNFHHTHLSSRGRRS